MEDGRRCHMAVLAYAVINDDSGGNKNLAETLVEKTVYMQKARSVRTTAGGNNIWMLAGLLFPIDGCPMWISK